MMFGLHCFSEQWAWVNDSSAVIFCLSTYSTSIKKEHDEVDWRILLMAVDNDNALGS